MRKSFVALLLAGALGACAPVAPSTAPSIPATTAPPTVAPTPIQTPPATQPAVTTAPTSTPIATTASGAPACEVADLKASHGLVEGDADARQTEIVLVSGLECLIDSTSGTAIQDGAGDVVAERAAGRGVAAIDLASGVAYTAEVRLMNWCVIDTAYPMTLTVMIGEDLLVVTGSSFPEEDDPPPCTSGGEPVLQATAWLAMP